MGRYRRILKHPIFLNYIDEISGLEKDRVYCGHSLEHLLAVARIAYIIVLEKRLPYDKDIVYAAGLLHDIGRVAQYKDGIPHEIAALESAPEVLRDCGYNEEETAGIMGAISAHRVKQEDNLAAVLYAADKQSRNCYLCKAADICNWPQEKRNHGII